MITLGDFSTDDEVNNEMKSSFYETLDQLIESNVFPSTCLLYKEENNEFDSTGSGFFLKTDDNYYMITAAHVVDESKNILIPIAQKEILLPLVYTHIIGTPKGKSKDEDKGEDRDEDKIDIAICKLDHSFGQNLEKYYKFVEFSRIKFNHQPSKDDMYLASGYHATGIKYNKKTKKTSAVMRSLLTKLNIPFMTHKHSQSFKNHIFTSIFRKLKKAGSDILNTRYNPHGISGSGLWLLEQTEKDGIYELDVKLVGINIEFWDEDILSLISTKIDLIQGGIQILDNLQ